MEMHGLIPEEPRPSTSRSIARFADSDSIMDCCISVSVFDFDVCIIVAQNECKRRSNLLLPLFLGLDSPGLAPSRMPQYTDCRAPWAFTAVPGGICRPSGRFA